MKAALIAAMILALALSAAHPAEWQLTTTGTFNWQPHWCGNEIWFSSFRGGHTDIWAIDDRGETYGARQITPTNDYLDYNPSQLTCDGVFFDSIGPDLQHDIYWVAAAGPPTPLLRSVSLANDMDPVMLAPFALVFTSDRAGDQDVLWMDPSGEIYGWGYLTISPANDRTPTCSPDGFFVAFASDRSGNLDIWIMDYRGETFGLWQLTDTPENEAAPAWSPLWPPETQYVAYHRAGQGIFAMNLTTMEEHQVTSGGTDAAPAWSPDGSHIAFQRASTDHLWCSDNVPDTPVEKRSWGRIKALFR